MNKTNVSSLIAVFLIFQDCDCDMSELLLISPVSFQVIDDGDKQLKCIKPWVKTSSGHHDTSLEINDNNQRMHYSDVIMGAIASQIAGITIVYSIVYSGAIKETSKPRVTGLCEGNSPVTAEFLAQTASNAENASIWWRHHVYGIACSAYVRQWTRLSLS